MDLECCRVGGEACRGALMLRDAGGVCSTATAIGVSVDMVVMDVESIVPSLSKRNVIRAAVGEGLTALDLIVVLQALEQQI
jgi:hypothetical protein